MLLALALTTLPLAPPALAVRFHDGDQTRPLPAVGAKDAGKLRDALSEALASSDPKDWRQCLALARKLEARFARASPLEVLAGGPEIGRGMPKARKRGKKRARRRIRKSRACVRSPRSA